MNPETLEAADRLVGDLASIGYRHFAVFNNTGLNLVFTTDLEVLRSLNRYLYKVRTGTEEPGLNNYDMLCLSEADDDVFVGVIEYYRSY